MEGCQDQDEGKAMPDFCARSGMRDDTAAQQALDAVLAGWNAAGRHWDMDAFVALYAEDAVFFGGRAGHSIGSDGVRILGE